MFKPNVLTIGWYKNKRCLPSRDCLDDALKHSLSQEDIRMIVEEGKQYYDERMQTDEEGRSLTKGAELVFVKLVPTYSFSINEEIWLIKHVGKKRI